MISAGLHREDHDNYRAVIVNVGVDYRVIDGANGAQWVLQLREDGSGGANSRPWTGIGYATTRDHLIAMCRSVCGALGPRAVAILQDLPRRHPPRRRRP